MNIEEGFNRIGKAVMWSGTGLAAISMLIGIGILFGTTSDKGISFAIACIVAVFFYGAGRLVKWLIEGFTVHQRAAVLSNSPDEIKSDVKSSNGAGRKMERSTLITLALFFLAFVIPIVYEAEFPHGGVNAASTLGYMFGAGLPILLIGWFSTTKSANSRTSFLMVLGALAIVWVSASCIKEWYAQNELQQSLKNVAAIVNSTAPPKVPIAATREEPAAEASPSERVDIVVPGHYDSGALRAAAFMDEMGIFIKKHSEKMQALDHKFEAPDMALGLVLVPDNFISSARLADSRGRLLRFQQLISERQKLISEYFPQFEELVKKSGLSESEKQTTLRGLRESMPVSINNYRKLDRSQIGLIKAAGEVLDIAERGMGTIRVEDNKVLFTSQEDLDTYNQRMASITQFAKEETDATKAILSLFESGRKDFNSMVQGK